VISLTHVAAADDSSSVATSVTLDFESRNKSRLRVRLDDGREARIMLKRGLVIEPGTVLESSNGERVRVEPGIEEVSAVQCAEPIELARMAYHLGNRHVAVEVGKNALYFQPDHVLDDMLRQLGAEVTTEQRAFRPESGAYGRSHAHHH
jgi:urease accessory protein